MDDALHLAAHLGFDGDNVAAVAEGDNWLLNDAASVRRVDQLLELGLEAVVDGAKVAADGGESGAGAVDDFGAGADAAVDVGGHVVEVADSLSELSKER